MPAPHGAPPGLRDTCRVPPPPPENHGSFHPQAATAETYRVAREIAPQLESSRLSPKPLGNTIPPSLCTVAGCPWGSGHNDQVIRVCAPAGPILSGKIFHVSGYCMDTKASVCIGPKASANLSTCPSPLHEPLRCEPPGLQRVGVYLEDAPETCAKNGTDCTTSLWISMSMELDTGRKKTGFPPSCRKNCARIK